MSGLELRSPRSRQGSRIGSEKQKRRRGFEVSGPKLLSLPRLLSDRLFLERGLKMCLHANDEKDRTGEFLNSQEPGISFSTRLILLM